MKSIELFAGAGGLCLGLSRAGFHPEIIVENDLNASNTLRININHLGTPASLDRYFNTRIEDIDLSQWRGIDIVSGGPPCQPFSTAGLHRGASDERNMFPEAVRALRETLPSAFIFENVKGLTRPSFQTYLSYITLLLQFPSVKIHPKETWQQHRNRLERMYSSGKNSTEYNVLHRVLNAADYGIPQKRERLFIVGFRSDIAANWNFPDPTHSEEQLATEKWITGEYWSEHKVPKKLRESPPQFIKEDFQRFSGNSPLGIKIRWQTVRDAIHDLPPPKAQSGEDFSHAIRGTAKVYQGHTGSTLDYPSKTIKAGRHGVPGGENMMVLADGTARYFTIREAARIQGFPDFYSFSGSWSASMRQIGNAVPPPLAEVLGRSVARSLRLAKSR